MPPPALPSLTGYASDLMRMRKELDDTKREIMQQLQIMKQEHRWDERILQNMTQMLKPQSPVTIFIGETNTARKDPRHARYHSQLEKSKPTETLFNEPPLETESKFIRITPKPSECDLQQLTLKNLVSIESMNNKATGGLKHRRTMKPTKKKIHLIKDEQLPEPFTESLQEKINRKLGEGHRKQIAWLAANDPEIQPNWRPNELGLSIKFAVP
jgi:hypothetical protein